MPAVKKKRLSKQKPRRKEYNFHKYKFYKIQMSLTWFLEMVSNLFQQYHFSTVWKNFHIVFPGLLSYFGTLDITDDGALLFRTKLF